MVKELPSENVSNALKIIEKAREDLLSDKSSTIQNLLALHYASQLLNREEEKKWAEEEIEADWTGKLPKYRKNVYCELRFENIEESIRKKLPKHYNIEFNIDVHRLSHFLKTKKDSFRLSAGHHIIKEFNEKYDQKLIEDQIYIIIPRAVVIEVLGSINLELSKKFANMETFARSLKSESVSEENNDFDPKKIFVVHGRDNDAKNQLQEILQNKFKLEPIILMNQPNEGKTVIEKFENHSLKIGFVFVLLTPDDIGNLKIDYDKNKENVLPRARENVILELGYFVGKLGRKRVCCIQKGEENLLPSDLHGLVTIRYQSTIKEIYSDIEDELIQANYISSR